MSDNNKSITSINGKLDDSLSIRDRGLMYGDGLFETFAYRHNKLEFLNLHLQRLSADCKRLAIPLDISLLKKELFEFQQQVIEDGNSQAVIKLIVSRGYGRRGYRVDPDSETSRIIICDPWPEHIDSISDSRNKGVTVQLCKTTLARSNVLAGIKHLNRLEQVMARLEWDDPSIYEGLLMDEFGSLIEGTCSNLFIVNARDEILTPCLNYSGVAGVMRRHIMENIAPKLGLSVCETNIDLQEFAEAQEVFITNSLIGILPVTKCQGSCWLVGETTKKLQNALQAGEK